MTDTGKAFAEWLTGKLDPPVADLPDDGTVHYDPEIEGQHDNTALENYLRNRFNN